jgi:hypothetical protein
MAPPASHCQAQSHPPHPMNCPPNHLSLLLRCPRCSAPARNRRYLPPLPASDTSCDSAHPRSRVQLLAPAAEGPGQSATEKVVCRPAQARSVLPCLRYHGAPREHGTSQLQVPYAPRVKLVRTPRCTLVVGDTRTVPTPAADDARDQDMCPGVLGPFHVLDERVRLPARVERAHLSMLAVHAPAPGGCHHIPGSGPTIVFAAATRGWRRCVAAEPPRSVRDDIKLPSPRGLRLHLARLGTGLAAPAVARGYSATVPTGYAQCTVH